MILTAPQQLPGSDPEVVPHRYVVVARAQRCSCCGATHTWSETYALTLLRPKLGLGKRISNLSRIERPKYRIPIEQIPVSRTDLIPFCHSCYQPTLAHTPGLLEPNTIDPQQVYGFSRTEPPVAAKEKPKAAKQPTRPATLEELKELLL